MFIVCFETRSKFLSPGDSIINFYMSDVSYHDFLSRYHGLRALLLYGNILNKIPNDVMLLINEYCKPCQIEWYMSRDTSRYSSSPELFSIPSECISTTTDQITFNIEDLEDNPGFNENEIGKLTLFMKIVIFNDIETDYSELVNGQYAGASFSTESDIFSVKTMWEYTGDGACGGWNYYYKIEKLALKKKNILNLLNEEFFI